MDTNGMPKRDITEVYTKYSDMLYRIAFMQLSSKEDAMDCVQDIFLKYMTAQLVFSSPEHEKAWFIRTLVNRCHDAYRKNRLRAHESLSVAENVCAHDYFSSDSLPLAQAISELPEKLRVVILLHYLEGYSADEIAEMLKIGASAVKMRLMRGRNALKEILEEGKDNV